MLFSFSPNIHRKLNVHSHQYDFPKLSLAEEIHIVHIIFSFSRMIVWFRWQPGFISYSKVWPWVCTLTGMCRYQSTRADRRKWLYINAQVSWKPASFLSSTDLLGQWVRSSAPSEVHRSWIMTLLFRAGLSPTETLHYSGTQDKIQYAPRGTRTVAAVLCLQPHMKRQHKVRSEGVQWDVGHGQSLCMVRVLRRGCHMFTISEN